MKTIIKYFSIFMLALVLALLVNTPLQLFVKAQKYGNIELSGIHGSVWSGQIDQLIIRNPKLKSPEVISNIRFQFKPGYLFLLRAQFYVSFDYINGKGSGNAALQLGKKLKLSDVEYQGEAHDFADKYAMGFVDFSGKINLFIKSLEYKLNSYFTDSVDANLSWQRAASPSPIALQLGNIQAIISQSEAKLPISAKLKNQGGDIGINIDASLSDKRSWQATGSLDNKANTPASLRSTLQMAFGAAQNGSYQIKRSGRF